MLQPWKFNPPAATCALWLAVTFHVSCGRSATGSDASSSPWVQGVLQSIAARTRATSAGVTKEAELPKLIRRYDAAAATQSSRFEPMGTITSEYVRPSSGPVSPCRIALIT